VIKHVRVARHCEPPTWPAKLAIVLLKLESVQDAIDLYHSLHGRAYNAFEPESRCNFAFVDGVTHSPGNGEDDATAKQSGGNFWGLFFQQQQQQQQQPQCVVCLERLVEGDSSEGELQLFTTACDHTFHTDCLKRWRDAPCPVCRYDHAGAHGRSLASMCDQCASSRDLWVCLLCGHVGCEHEHALEHFEATKHAYAINVDHRHVWDFVGQGYVHRLGAQQQSEASSGTAAAAAATPPTKASSSSSNDDVARTTPPRDGPPTDGSAHDEAAPATAGAEEEEEKKGEIRAIAEVLVDEGDVLVGQPSASSRRRRRPGPPSFAVRGDKAYDPKKVLWWNDDDAEDDRAYDHRKLEGLAVEYNELLRSQLAKQRDVYEARLRDLQAADGEDDEDALRLLRRRRRGVDAKRATLRAKIDDVEREVRFEDDLFQTIQADLVQWKEELARAQLELRDVQARRDALVPLFEKRARDKMAQLDDDDGESGGAVVSSEGGDHAVVVVSEEGGDHVVCGDPVEESKSVVAAGEHPQHDLGGLRRPPPRAGARVLPLGDVVAHADVDDEVAAVALAAQSSDEEARRKRVPSPSKSKRRTARRAKLSAAKRAGDAALEAKKGG